MGEELTERQKLAIAVAEDALKWLPEAKVEQGVYLEGVLPGSECLSGDMQTYSDAVIANCEMCAMGAALVAKARVMDHVPMRDFFFPSIFHDGARASTKGTKIVKNLEGVFSGKTLRLMEVAFELEQIDAEAYAHGAKSWEVRDAIAFGEKFGQPRERCIAVFKEVVRQKGEFNPLLALDHYAEQQAAQAAAVVS